MRFEKNIEFRSPFNEKIPFVKVTCHSLAIYLFKKGTFMSLAVGNNCYDLMFASLDETLPKEKKLTQ